MRMGEVFVFDVEDVDATPIPAPSGLDLVTLLGFGMPRLAGLQ